MQLYFVHTINENQALADDNESRHLSKVMRKSVGELAYITAGDGDLWQAEILQLNRSGAIFKPLKKIRRLEETRRLSIVVAPTKSASRIEDLLEKGVEMGLTDLYLVKTERTMRKEFKTKRLNKLAVSAMKQCFRLHLTRIHEMTSFNSFLQTSALNYEHKYIGKIEGSHPTLVEQEMSGNVIVAIGPEGDFTDKEYATATQHGFIPVSLSENRLRTETAGIMAIAMVQNKRIIIKK